MAFDPEFLELMPHQVTLKPPATTNLYGEKTYGPAITPAPHAHIEYKQKQVYGDGGKIVRTEMGVVYLDGSYDVNTAWQMTLPTPGGGTKEVEIISIDQNTDEDGYHHTAVHFGDL